MPNLIRLRFALGVLNIHTRISRPRGLEDGMAGAALTWLTKVSHADLVQIWEANLGWGAAHLLDNLRNRRHSIMVSIVEPLCKSKQANAARIPVHPKSTYIKPRLEIVQAGLDVFPFSVP